MVERFEIKEWTPEHEAGLSVSDRVQLIRMEDAKAAKMVNYIEPASDSVQPYKSAAHAITDLVVTLAPPVVGLVAVGGVVCIVVSATAAVVGAVTAFVSANAFLIGGGALAFAVAVGLFSRGEKQSVGSGASTPHQTINVTVNVAGQNVTANGKAQ